MLLGDKPPPCWQREPIRDPRAYCWLHLKGFTRLLSLCVTRDIRIAFCHPLLHLHMIMLRSLSRWMDRFLWDATVSQRARALSWTDKHLSTLHFANPDNSLLLTWIIPDAHCVCDCWPLHLCPCVDKGLRLKFIFLFLLSGDGGYARDSRLKAPSALAVAPNGTLYIADLGNIRIRAVSPNQPQGNPTGLVEISSPLDQELYLFSQVHSA